MDDVFPPPPPELVQLRELNDRWGDVVDWALDATSEACAQRSRDINRGLNAVRACNRYEARLEEIDRVEMAFKEAYEQEKLRIDHDPILEYGVLIKPIVDERTRAEARVRQEAQFRAAEKKTEIFQAREEKKRRRAAKKMAGVAGRLGVEVGRDRDLPQADRQAQATDQGAGGGALAADRGLQDATGRDAGAGPTAGAGGGPPTDDRVEPPVGGVDRQGPTEPGV